MAIKDISILGSGWLGLPLAKAFKSIGYNIKASTTSEHRLTELSQSKLAPFWFDIDKLTNDNDNHRFLQSEILIINIPSKNIAGFQKLIRLLESSMVKSVIFISSTSVYNTSNEPIVESDEDNLVSSPLVEIENCFKKSKGFDSTIVRFGGLIGYERNPANFFKHGRTVKNPDAEVNLIHRDDCINIIIGIVEKSLWDETFNCCADSHPTKREFYTYASLQAGKTPPIFEETTTPHFKVISNDKVKRVLPYNFIHSDLMGIRF